VNYEAETILQKGKAAWAALGIALGLVVLAVHRNSAHGDDGPTMERPKKEESASLRYVRTALDPSLRAFRAENLLLAEHAVDDPRTNINSGCEAAIAEKASPILETNSGFEICFLSGDEGAPIAIVATAATALDRVRRAQSH
jgi:hypothetical protein